MEEIIVRKPPQKVDGICNKKKVLIYNDDRELFIYKKIT